jgi:hypothetical protein
MIAILNEKCALNNGCRENKNISLIKMAKKRKCEERKEKAESEGKKKEKDKTNRKTLTYRVAR